MSGQVQRDVVAEAVTKEGVPVVRRFSGGGTVYIDASTLFSTLISTADFLRPDQVLLHACRHDTAKCTDRLCPPK
jgi:lipoate-protein ligase A